ncbi:MAG: HEPN domain-containing protein [Candidatus Thorarchaeota archaeon]
MIRRPDEFKRWIDQAENTLASAEHDKVAGFFNWACFKAHQCVEFALKAALWGNGLSIRGHSLIELFSQIRDNLEIDLSQHIDCLRRLERLYIPTRYADAFIEGAPHAFFGENDANEALACSKEIFASIKEVWAVNDDK